MSVWEKVMRGMFKSAKVSIGEVEVEEVLEVTIRTKEGSKKFNISEGVSVFITGDCEEIESVNGDVFVEGSAKEITTVNGDVEVKGICHGKVSTVNGDIAAGYVGHATTQNGSIT